MFPSKEIVERVRKEYPVGSRVELLRMDDPQAPPVGTLGTVVGVDDTASILVRWDNGSGLNVVYGTDMCRILLPGEVPGSSLTLILENGEYKPLDPIPKIDPMKKMMLLVNLYTYIITRNQPMFQPIELMKQDLYLTIFLSG